MGETTTGVSETSVFPRGLTEEREKKGGTDTPD